MEFDRSEITPGKWKVIGPSEHAGCVYLHAQQEKEELQLATAVLRRNFGEDLANLQLCALARNAEEAMFRRKWGVIFVHDKWIVNSCGEGWVWADGRYFTSEQSPFLALVEADEWFKANVDGKEKP